MATRKALGRGLAALIPPTKPRTDSTPDGVDSGEGQLHIAISRIAPNPNQPRKSFDDAKLAEMTRSIMEKGILQPLVVRRRGDGYELIIGERRWRAAQRAGMHEVPAVVLDAGDREVVEMALVENVQRADLNPIELAQAFLFLTEREGMTQEEAGRRVGIERSSVANHLRLLELDSEIQQDLIEQRLSMGHAKAILQAPRDQRHGVRDQIVRAGLSVRGAEELSRRIASSGMTRASSGGPTRDVHVVQLEDRLRLGAQTKVRVIGRRNKGRIELYYHGEGELDRLAALLLGESI